MTLENAGRKWRTLIRTADVLRDPESERGNRFQMQRRQSPVSHDGVWGSLR